MEVRDGLGWLRGWPGVSKSSLKLTLLWCQVLSCSQVQGGKRKGSGPRRVSQPWARYPEEWGLSVLADVQSLSEG